MRPRCNGFACRIRCLGACPVANVGDIYFPDIITVFFRFPESYTKMFTKKSLQRIKRPEKPIYRLELISRSDGLEILPRKRICSTAMNAHAIYTMD